MSWYEPKKSGSSSKVVCELLHSKSERHACSNIRIWKDPDKYHDGKAAATKSSEGEKAHGSKTTGDGNQKSKQGDQNQTKDSKGASNQGKKPG